MNAKNKEFRLAKIFADNIEEVTKVEFLDELNFEDFQNFEKSARSIDGIKHLTRLLGFALDNDRQLIDYLNFSAEDLTRKAQHWNGVKRSHSEAVFLNCNRLLLNYLSSAITFIDHSKTYFTRKYGSTSVEIEEFKKICSLFYDNSFAYRFFYKLRNYSLHVGMPIHNVTFSSKHDRKDNSLEGVLRICFDRDGLLAGYDGWGPLKVEISLLEKEFDLAPLLLEMTHDLEEIGRNIIILNSKEILSAGAFILDRTNHLKDDNSEIFVAHNFRTKDAGEFAGYSSIFLPFDAIYEFCDILKSSTSV